jgi:hypothetical protein
MCFSKKNSSLPSLITRFFNHYLNLPNAFVRINIGTPTKPLIILQYINFFSYIHDYLPATSFNLLKKSTILSTTHFLQNCFACRFS